MLTKDDAIRMAFHRDSRIPRTPIGIRAACVEQGAVLLESWWAFRVTAQDSHEVESFRWVAYQTLVHVLLWKFSEAFSSDKRLGIPFWSVRALESLQKYGCVTTPAWFKNQRLAPDDALVHEHVRERSSLANWLLDRSQSELMREGKCDRSKLGVALAKLCVGCVVTQAEHKHLDEVKADDRDWQNPWGRYARVAPRIYLVANGKLSAASEGTNPLSDAAILRQHHRLIEQAGIYAPQ
jgi:hypothetical protein